VSLIDFVVTEIKTRIMDGRYAEDELLPSQDEMAVELGVSRATLREAFNQLSMMGLVQIKHGVGSYAKRPNPSEFFDKFSSLVIMNRRSAEELLQARSIIEPSVVALAAVEATREDMDSILKALEVMEREFKTGYIENYKAKDHRFHLSVAAGSHNQVLINVVVAIRELLPAAIDRAFVQSRHLVSSAMDYHRRIYEAIERHDPESAKRNMEEHLLTVRELHHKVLD
jgi:GntR family transcriptional repressor for pyruvate dehydrogenase complex